MTGNPDIAQVLRPGTRVYFADPSAHAGLGTLASRHALVPVTDPTEAYDAVIANADQKGLAKFSAAVGMPVFSTHELLMWSGTARMMGEPSAAEVRAEPRAEPRTGLQATAYNHGPAASQPRARKPFHLPMMAIVLGLVCGPFTVYLYAHIAELDADRFIPVVAASYLLAPIALLVWLIGGISRALSHRGSQADRVPLSNSHGHKQADW